MLKIIDQGDICPLFGVMLILFVPGWMVASDRQKKWGVVIGVIGFLAYGGYALDAFPPKNADAVFSIALRALTVFGLVWGLSLLILPLVYGVFVFLREKVRKARAVAEDARRKHEMEEETKRNAIAREEAERQAVPEAERMKQEAMAARAEARKIRKRFDDARASLLLVYQQQGHRIAERLPREQFEELMKKFLDETKPPEEFEHRAIQLLNLILGFVSELTPEVPTGPNAEVIAARTETEKFYLDRPEIHVTCPLPRFQAEIRVRIPDHATAEAAWKEARDMMKEILDLSVDVKQKPTEQPTFNPPLTNV